MGQQQSTDIIESLPDAVLVIDRDRRVTIWNHALECMTGIPAAQMLGRNDYAVLFYGENSKKQSLLIDFVFQDDPEQDTRYTNLDRKGDTLTAEIFCNALNQHQGAWILVKVSLRRDSSGQLTDAIKIVSDITVRKQTEKALRQSQELFSLFMQHSPVYVYIKAVTPTESRVLQASENFRHLIGISDRDMVGKTMAELFPSELATQITADDWAVVSRGEVLTLDEAFNGRHYSTIKFPLVQGDQTLLAGYSIDITERRQTEFALANALQHISAHMDNSPLAVIEFDFELRIIRWSQEAERLFGWAAKDIVGYRVFEIAWAYPDDVAEMQVKLESMINSNLPHLIDVSSHFHKDGTVVDCIWYSSAIYDVAGQFTSMLCLVLDITERKRLELELRQQATTDELTRVSNRRHFFQLSSQEIKCAIRLNHALTIALIDLDYFKSINDQYGHAVGDQALLALTAICRKHLREIDVLARFGGDEFVVLFPEANHQQAYECVERIRQALTLAPINLSGIAISIKISAGIAGLTTEDTDLESLLARADQALYQAKAAGRNCSKVATMVSAHLPLRNC